MMAKQMSSFPTRIRTTLVADRTGNLSNYSYPDHKADKVAPSLQFLRADARSTRLVETDNPFAAMVQVWTGLQSGNSPPAVCDLMYRDSAGSTPITISSETPTSKQALSWCIATWTSQGTTCVTSNSYFALRGWLF